MAKDKVRVAFVGSGGIAQAHLKELSQMADVELVGFCDVVEDKAQRAATQYGGHAFTCPRAMFGSVQADAAWICLPPFAHGDAEMSAIEHGVPFIVEKPVGLDLGQCREIAAAAAEKGLITAAAYMNRYRKGIQRARELFATDPPVLSLGGWIGGSPTPVPGTISHWWIQRHKSGGQYVEQVTHTTDLVRYLCGEATHVFAFGAKGFNVGIPDYTIDDAAAVSILLKNGGVANLCSCCASGASGGVWLDVFAKQTCARFSGWEHTAKITVAGQETEEIAGEGDIFRIEDAAFIQAVKSGDASGVLSTYADGVESLALGLAANRAIETGQVQEL
ncbi:MAG TPA: Gfo/Idh/MocA family oxidoreductase [Armatimonadota bacterium]|nr:Gfo/Idh/MocA family oxidoreductase [Armatimonadota bacterium]